MSASDEPQLGGPTPERVLTLGFAFWGSKTLLSAVELGVFATLAGGPLSAADLRVRLGLDERSVRDFLDALVALGMLERDDPTGGDAGTDPVYRNTAETDLFLDPAKSASYVGGLLEMANNRLYGFWGSLTEALRTGQAQNETKGGSGDDPFAAMYADPDHLAVFLAGMTGVSAGPAMAIANTFPWENHQTFCDLGTAQGMLPVQLALRHPHLQGIGVDLPPVGPIFEKFVADFGLRSRVHFQAADFFTDPLPPAEVYVMGHILHDWGMDAKRLLLRRVYDALPVGGALIVYDAVIDDTRRTNAFGLLMSLNMLIETPDGFDYTGADCRAWMTDTGFRDSYVAHLGGPESMVVGLK